MPNIITIVDDNKIRRQIEGFFKELDAEGNRVRFFTTGFEFEQTYFGNKDGVLNHPLNVLAGLEKYTAELLDATLTTPVSPQPLTAHSTLKIRAKVGVLLMENIDPVLDSKTPFLGVFPEDLIKTPDLIGSKVHPKFAPFWNQLIADSEKSKAFAVLPLIDNDLLHWIKISMQKLNSTHMQLEFEEVTHLFRDKINSEIQLRQAPKEDDEALKLFSEIDMIIFKIDCVSAKVPQWVEQTYKKLKAGNFFAPEKSIRFVLLKYEDDGIGKLETLHPKLDDLVYLPLDRLIFLQTIEILFALPKKATPSYLFTKPVEIPLEVSKLTKLEKISDLGIVIRNPVPLVKGLLAHFFLTFPEAEGPIDFWGKAVASRPHPERKGEFLVTFSFFALRRSESIAIKGFLSRGARFNPFIEQDRQKFLTHSDDLFAPDSDRSTKTIAILDLDENIVNQVKQIIPKDIDQTQVVGESNLSTFFSRYLAADTLLSQQPSAAGPMDFPFSPFSFVINPENLEFLSMTDTLTDEQTFFGVKATEAFSIPTGWQKPFMEIKENPDLLPELVALARAGKRVSRVVFAINSTQNVKLCRLTVSSQGASGHLKVDLSWPNKDDLKSLNLETKIKSLDAVVADLNLVPGGNVDSFITAITERAQSKGLIPSGKAPKFIFLTDDDKSFKPRNWANPLIAGVIAKPLEPRHLSFLVCNAIESRFSIYRLDNMGWYMTLLPIHVAKQVIVEAISEYGAEIRHSRPIAPGTILYLRGGIYDNAPNKCLATRFYHCEEHPKEKGQYICSAFYFGINDHFMKYARRWFRESYAQAKQSSEGKE